MGVGGDKPTTTQIDINIRFHKDIHNAAEPLWTCRDICKALSRRKQGFEFPRERQWFQLLREKKAASPVFGKL
jgi:hypothetical protein